MKRFFSCIILTLFLNGFLGLLNHAYAADFEINIEKTLTIDSPESLDITETRTIRNNSKNRLVSKDNQEVFQIILIDEDSEKLKDSFLSAETFIDGVIVQNLEGNTSNDSKEVIVPYNSVIGVGQSKQFKIQYQNYGLTKTTGALLDIFFPGFGKNYRFEDKNTLYSYKTTIKLNKNLGEVGFVVPNPVSTVIDGDYYIYEISQESLVGSKIWIQLGKTQFYHFILTQNVTASDSLNKGYFNEYNLIIPRDMFEYETTQKVFFKSFDPEPSQIITDEDGNLIATFKMPSHKNGEIKVEGYAQVSRTGNQASERNSGDIKDINQTVMSRSLRPAEYWESDNPLIMERARELKAEQTNIYKIIETNYSHIVDTIDYSEVKRFGINNRQGALKTLQGGAAVCMEYSDLFLALSRAQGIPTRAVFGYGYDARIDDNKKEAHQWVQVFLPKLTQWLSVDVTWGESGTTLIGGDLNHFYTHVAVTDPNTPPSINRTSYGRQAPLEPPDFEISAIKEIPAGMLLSTNDILKKYPEVTKNQFEVFIDDLTIRVQTSNIPASLSRNADYMVYGGLGLFVLTLILLLKAILSTIIKWVSSLKTKSTI